MDSTAQDLMGPKIYLQFYLRAAREALLWKLEGLGERELRWPMTDTGTNLLGIVKHVASVQYDYLGVCFGRPGEELPWLAEDAPDNADMWATAEESATWVRDLYRRSSEHADATVAALNLDTIGEVPWWPEDRRSVTLGRILVHLIAETNRHAGHADIVREQVDGMVGLRDGNDNMPPGDAEKWATYVRHLKDVAEQVDRS